MRITQKIAIGLSVFSLASPISISSVYIDFRRAVNEMANGDWGTYLKLSNSHPGGALEALLHNLFSLMHIRTSVVHSSVQFYLTLLFPIALLFLSGFYIYKIVRNDAHNPLFMISVFLNGLFHLVIQLGMLNMHIECYPNRGGFCGFLGGVAIAIVSMWILLLSVLFLMIDGVVKFRNRRR